MFEPNFILIYNDIKSYNTEFFEMTSRIFFLSPHFEFNIKKGNLQNNSITS